MTDIPNLTLTISAFGAAILVLSEKSFAFFDKYTGNYIYGISVHQAVSLKWLFLSDRLFKCWLITRCAS
jgi:hypothetical protein